MNTIVVGVDHSQQATEALRFALEEAKLRHATLRVVHAWQYSFPGAPGIRGPSGGGDFEKARDAAETKLEAAVRKALPDRDSVVIERRVVEGRPAAVLVAESRDADLLVVGSRGHGGFTELLLGSVSQQASHHAECPVVIVRPKKGSG